ncbi:MAG: 1,2-phenylacetyl-CoA epoxidase subunit PaaE [Ferruginibacter sp.]
MAVHFHPLRVKKIIKETADCVSVSFDIPAHLEKEFSYKEGQNITVKAIINGKEVRRSYSICSAPHEHELKVAVKKVLGGSFSEYANELLKEDDTLDILPPTGNFHSKSSAGTTENLLAIAAGSGITPIISIIKHCLQTRPESSCTLLYGNKSRGSIIFFDELEGLKNKYMHRFNFINVLSRERTESPVNYGRIDAEKLSSLKKLIDYKNSSSIFICGPEQMIFSATDFLIAEGIEKSRIHFELFTIPGQTASVKNETFIENVKVTTGPKSIVTVKLDGRSFNFELGFGGMNILDAALQEGADLPYACKGGVCCTCKARLVEGKVEMDANYALEPEEVSDGYILTCQSHPRSEKVMIDFDIK